MSAAAWVAPSAPPALQPGTVDVWRADLALAGERERALLSPEERERAARFARAEDGRRWGCARGILRALLGACLDGDPAELRFVEGPYGKPALEGGELRFNLSHSGEVALYAIAPDREVGVDVELPRRAVDGVAIARRVLGEVEAQRLAAIADPARRQREFLRAWVRWEAVLKCRGTGIGGAERGAPDPEPWLCDLHVGAPAAAALAVAGGRCALRRWRWTPAVAR